MSTSYEPAHCIVCGHADAEVVASGDDLRDEVEWLWAYHARRLRPDTPPEHLLDRVAFSQRPPLRVVQCRECGLVYRNPVEREHELIETYARETPAHNVLQSLHDTQLPAMRTQARVLRDVLGRGGTGLEIGSYVGGFLSAASECDLQFEGLDINAGVNAFTRNLGFVVHDGSLATFTASSHARRFDCVAIWNTFDQLSDPRGAVRDAKRLLAPGGIVVVRVPNGEYYARTRRDENHWPLLAQNNLLTFPYRWGFSPRSLGALFGEFGLEIVRERGDVLVPIADEWTLRWAAEEERDLKRAMRDGSPAAESPWFELYVREGGG